MQSYTMPRRKRYVLVIKNELYEDAWELLFAHRVRNHFDREEDARAALETLRPTLLAVLGIQPESTDVIAVDCVMSGEVLGRMFSHAGRVQR